MNCARNIITANFGGGTSTTTSPLWQWDYGQVLCITGIEDLPAAFEVHFSINRAGGVSTVAVGADGQVTIPNVLLTIGKNLNAWIYLSEAQGEGETEYSIFIPVKARPMPETYDAEVTGEFDDVVRQVSEYAETAQTAANSAGASATAAAGSASAAAASEAAAAENADRAEYAMREAVAAQNEATTQATIATEKASQASGYATAAAQSATSAEQSKTAAANAATAAGQAASAAGNSAATASTKATDAAASASDAAQSATAATTASTNAAASATDASASATAAAARATAASGSAQTASTAAQTATEKAAEASASATAAEAAKDVAVESATTATAKAAEAAQSASDADADADRAEDAAELAQTTVNALALTKTASGNMVTITDGADGMPLRKLSVDITAVQSGSGDPSPENIRPISGFDAVTVTRARKNYWNGDIAAGFNLIDCLVPGETYTFSARLTGAGNVYLYLRRTVKGVIPTTENVEFLGNIIMIRTVTPKTITVESGYEYYFWTNSTSLNQFDQVQIELGTTATDYEAPQIQSVTIPLGDTVYGGTLDVTTGKLTVTHVSVTHTGSATIGMPIESKFYIRAGCEGAKTENTTTGYLSNLYVFGGADNGGSSSVTEDDHFYAQPSANPTRIWVYDSRFTSVADFKAYLAEHPLTVVYPLAEPTVIDLTPDNLTTLKGLNHIWANSGATTVEYCVDMASGIADIARETVRIDDTLTNEGEAADAKATGEAIADVRATVSAGQIVASASGAVASFTDGADGVPVRSLAVEMSPIQDLHGQDNPYPAGGGVNLFDESTVTIGNWWTNSGNLSTNAPYGCVSADIPATGGETYAIKCYGEIPYSMSVVEFDDNGFLTRSHIANSQTKTVTTTAGTTKIAIQFAAGGDADTPMTADILASYKAVFYKGATAPDAYSPYSNICPISGRTEVTVTRTGINIWDEVWELGNISNTTGANANATDRIRSVNYVAVKPGTHYYVKTQSAVGLRFYDFNKNFLGYATKSNASFITANNCYYIRFTITSITEYGYDTSINYPASDHDYHPGTVQSVTFPLGDTVYGGTVDLATGKLTVNRVSVDMGTLAWLRTHSGISTEGGYIFYCTSIEFAHLPMLCSMYPYVGTVNSNAQAYNQGDKTVSQLINATRVYIRDDTYTTVDNLKTALSGQQLVYYLTTPLEIDLTPAQLTTLLGINNIWSDAGDVSVDYVADTKLYIEALTAPDADMVADANITSGHYFMVGNSLYLATANIASGAAITPGVNCTKTNLAEALNAINS